MLGIFQIFALIARPHISRRLKKPFYQFAHQLNPPSVKTPPQICETCGSNGLMCGGKEYHCRMNGETQNFVSGLAVGV